MQYDCTSILEARGFRNFTEIESGFNAIAKKVFLKQFAKVKVNKLITK
jgi:hypothetical protein